MFGFSHENLITAGSYFMISINVRRLREIKTHLQCEDVLGATVLNKRKT